MKVINEVVEILDLLYKHGWDERNGGNLSYIVDKNEIEGLCDLNKTIREYKYDFDMSLFVVRLKTIVVLPKEYFLYVPSLT